MTAQSGGNAGTRMLPMMALNLCTGTAVALVAQFVTNMDIADSRVQALAWAKYLAMLVFTSLRQRHTRQSSVGASVAHKRSDDAPQPAAGQLQPGSRARRLMWGIGMIDLVAYSLHSVGFALCGAATASVVFAATSQTFTALLTRFVLKRKLARSQIAAVAIVLLGILLRGACGSGGSKSADGGGVPPGQRLGYACILGAAFGYACLGVVYDYMMQTEAAPPSHASVMDVASRIGLAATTAYQIAFTLPRWQALVGDHLQRGSTSPAAAAVALATFGAVIVLHILVQGVVHRSEGALAVGLVGAIVSATVSIGASLLYCSPATPWQCLTPCRAASAAVVTAGGVVWVAGKKPAAEPAGSDGRASKKLD